LCDAHAVLAIIGAKETQSILLVGSDERHNNDVVLSSLVPVNRTDLRHLVRLHSIWHQLHLNEIVLGRCVAGIREGRTVASWLRRLSVHRVNSLLADRGRSYVHTISTFEKHWVNASCEGAQVLLLTHFCQELGNFLSQGVFDQSHLTQVWSQDRDLLRFVALRNEEASQLHSPVTLALVDVTSLTLFFWMWAMPEKDF